MNQYVDNAALPIKREAALEFGGGNRPQKECVT
jgi:hypothetical protein